MRSQPLSICYSLELLTLAQQCLSHVREHPRLLEETLLRGAYRTSRMVGPEVLFSLTGFQVPSSSIYSAQKCLTPMSSASRQWRCRRPSARDGRGAQSTKNDDL